MNEREKLAKLIQENPTLPLVFYVSNEELLDYCGYTIHEKFTCDIKTIYFVEDYYGSKVYDDYEEVVEKVQEILADDEKYKDLTDEEFEIYVTPCVASYIEEKIRHYKAIVIYTEP